MAAGLGYFSLVCLALLGRCSYRPPGKRTFFRMLFAVAIVVNSANLNLVPFARFIPDTGGPHMSAISARDMPRTVHGDCVKRA